MEFKINVSRDNLYIAAIMFMVGAFTYSVLDYLGTPTVEETAAWKAKEELEMMEMEMFMKVMGACPTK
jgi:hypothetical protein